ncbi:transcription factor bHLH90-like isoform X2 [Gossypium australe]|uniref:Transcription factor bHLH90-like isoform X2 n=1 Tax=Gossypium australe TaxID=47621 RepID=A0A5B6V0F6_9ROSI|nr:transcription factor bHLH90-like isoform X2 [Gossypium australe]
MSAIEENHVASGISEMAKMEVHVEVNQITKREFWIKLCYKHKRSGFAKLMEGMDSLGLGVIDANITTFNGNVLNIFKVELILSVPLVQGKQGFRVQAIERLVDPPNKLDKQRYTV